MDTELNHRVKRKSGYLEIVIPTGEEEELARMTQPSQIFRVLHHFRSRSQTIQNRHLTDNLTSREMERAIRIRMTRLTPEAMIAGNTLVRLKKARGYLSDAISGLDAAEAEKLADASWLQTLRQKLEGLKQTTQSLIDEVRAGLRANGSEF